MSDEDIIELPNYKESGWRRLEFMDVMENTLICDCNCPNTTPAKVHYIRVTVTRKEELAATSAEGLIKLRADKIRDGLQKLAAYKCPEVEDA